MNARKTESLRCDADGRTWFGAGSHRVVQGIHVLDLRGTPYEMGRQHGALLKAQIPDGPIFYFRDYVEKLVKSSGLGILTPLVRGLLRQTVGRTVARKLPDYARASIRGMADGSGLKFADVLDGCTMPDSLMWVVARMIQARRVGPAVQHRLALSLGCTSAIAWGSATADGRLLHARNLDYHGVEAWPKHTAVIFHTPDQGKRYVSVASAGVLMGGATAMNDQGLTLTVHQHMFTDGTRLESAINRGRPGDARGVDPGRGRGHPAAVPLHRLLDLPHRRRQDQRGPLLRGEPEAAGGSQDHQGKRAVRLREHLPGSAGGHGARLVPLVLAAQRRPAANNTCSAARHDPTDMAILADEGRTDCRIRDSICMLMTVASVVFRPEDGTLWVGTGEAPTSQNPSWPSRWPPATCSRARRRSSRGRRRIRRARRPSGCGAMRTWPASIRRGRGGPPAGGRPPARPSQAAALPLHQRPAGPGGGRGPRRRATARQASRWGTPIPSGWPASTSGGGAPGICRGAATPRCRTTSGRSRAPSIRPLRRPRQGTAGPTLREAPASGWTSRSPTWSCPDRAPLANWPSRYGEPGRVRGTDVVVLYMAVVAIGVGSVPFAGRMGWPVRQAAAVAILLIFFVDLMQSTAAGEPGWALLRGVLPVGLALVLAQRPRGR
ncbi:MAG: C45 family peptidase [bacterium]